MANKKKFKMFEASRIRFDQLKEDVTEYIKSVYKTNGQEYTSASPFSQIITVLLHLGRMILFYVESAMTETNINTAVHERSIRGISTLTGHNPSRGIAARGTLKMIYNKKTEYDGYTLNIGNFTKIKNTSNGLTYLIVFPGDSMQYTVGVTSAVIEVPIIQGELKYQQGTGNGMGMQSFNFVPSSNETIDDYYVNVYVNGTRWKTTQSILDMTYDEKACIIKTGAVGGVDVFFGNGVNGAVPESGSTVLLEYLVCSGSAGNINDYSDAESVTWRFDGDGTFLDGSSVDLNKIFNLSPSSNIMFGTDGESVSMTRALAPHASRSFVLANKTNYEYFLRRLNMFSVIDVIQGFNTFEDNEAQVKYDIAEKKYITTRDSYLQQVKLTGQNSISTEEKYNEMTVADDELTKAQNLLNNSKLDDNILYLFLVPKLENRINETNNYFTCNKNAFILSTQEKESILNLIEQSGQKILTVDNVIIDPKMPMFSINIFIQMWSDYIFDNVKSSIISEISTYLLNNTRRDRIPLSDITRVVEGVNGVDSVSVYFDADKNNEIYYGKGNYGIDDFGDIVLERSLVDSLGNTITVKDIFPLFRGNFVSANNVEYSDDLTSISGPVNITLRGTTNSTMSDKLNILK